MDFAKSWKIDMGMGLDKDVLKIRNEVVNKLKEKGNTTLYNDIKKDEIRFEKLVSSTGFMIYNPSLKMSVPMIFLETDSLLQEPFNSDDRCAIVLHELGHIYNIPTYDDIPNNAFREYHEEYYADDFVRGLGFEKELSECLEKQYKNEIERKGKDYRSLIPIRVNRIKNNEEIKKGINIWEFYQKIK